MHLTKYIYKEKLDVSLQTEKHMNNYLKYGSIYWKKYCIKTDYGDWNNNFTMEILEKFIENYYNNGN